MCRINPRIDFAFKKLFGSESNKDLLISLVNSIVPKEDQVRDLKMKNPYNFADYQAGKMSILDIKAEGMNGTLFNIEMQVGDDCHFDKRSLYYWARLITDQIHTEGQAYKLIEKTICINILDFKMARKKDPAFHSVYRILNEKTGLSDSLHGLLQIHYVELERFKTKTEDLKTALDRWTAFLVRAHDLNKEKLPKTLDDPAIKKAMKEVDRMFDEEERAIYIIRRDSNRDAHSKIESAKEQVEIAQKRVEKAQREKEKAQREKEKAQREKEKAQKRAEKAQREKEEERRLKEEALKELEELKALLKDKD